MSAKLHSIEWLSIFRNVRHATTIDYLTLTPELHDMLNFTSRITVHVEIIGSKVDFLGPHPTGTCLRDS